MKQEGCETDMPCPTNDDGGKEGPDPAVLLMFDQAPDHFVCSSLSLISHGHNLSGNICSASAISLH